MDNALCLSKWPSVFDVMINSIKGEFITQKTTLFQVWKKKKNYVYID